MVEYHERTLSSGMVKENRGKSVLEAGYVDSFANRVFDDGNFRARYATLGNTDFPDNKSPFHIKAQSLSICRGQRGER